MSVYSQQTKEKDTLDNSIDWNQPISGWDYDVPSGSYPPAAQTTGDTYIIQAPAQSYQRLDNRQPLNPYPYGAPGTIQQGPTTYTIIATPIVSGSAIQVYKN